MDRRKRIIEAAEKALIELEKVIKQKIDLSELDPEKAKTAAQAKWVAIWAQMYSAAVARLNESSDDARFSGSGLTLKVRGLV